MKAYVINDDFKMFTYPEEMKKIMNYLDTYGKLNVSSASVEILYRKYSHNYWGVKWEPVSDFTLESFARWLSEQEV